MYMHSCNYMDQFLGTVLILLIMEQIDQNSTEELVHIVAAVHVHLMTTFRWLPPMNLMLENPEAQEKFIAQCDTACAIFFCGGDQSFIAKVIHTVPGLNDYLVKLYEDGVPLAGTPAGCAVMSNTMITGEGNFEVIDYHQVETKPGFGLVKNALLDQHFIRRKRMNRLLSVFSQCNEYYAVGIDEEMAVAITDDIRCEVLGDAS